MIYDNFKIIASPAFTDVSCPKGHGDMIELDDGWFKQCWYCRTCKYPYTLKLVKMQKVNKENLTKLLSEKLNKELTNSG